MNENVTSSSGTGSQSSCYSYDEEGEAEQDEPSVSAPFQHLTHGNVEIEEVENEDEPSQADQNGNNIADNPVSFGFAHDSDNSQSPQTQTHVVI